MLRRVFGKGKPQEAEATATTRVACPHTVLLPRWDNLADMGKEDRASRYVCDSCHETFPREEAEQLRASESERLKRELAGGIEP